MVARTCPSVNVTRTLLALFGCVKCDLLPEVFEVRMFWIMPRPLTEPVTEILKKINIDDLLNL